MVTAEEILAPPATREFDLTPAAEPRGSAPAELFLVDGGPATVGVIASVTRPFCGDCDRVRLTADGQVRNCLFAREESDLRAPLRAGASDEELAERWVTAMRGKRAGPRHRRPVVPPARPADVARSAADRRAYASRRPSQRAGRRRSTVWTRARRSRRGSPARRGSRTATPGARRTPARSCAAPACAAWGCSRAAPRRPSAWQPFAEQVRDSAVADMRGAPGAGGPEMGVPDDHGGSRPASKANSDGGG